MWISNNVQFSTYDAPHDNADGECLAEFKDANWHNGGGIDRLCSSQSVNGIYKGKYITPSQFNGVFFGVVIHL